MWKLLSANIPTGKRRARDAVHAGAPIENSIPSRDRKTSGQTVGPEDTGGVAEMSGVLLVCGILEKMYKMRDS